MPCGRVPVAGVIEEQAGILDVAKGDLEGGEHDAGSHTNDHALGVAAHLFIMPSEWLHISLLWIHDPEAHEI